MNLARNLRLERLTLTLGSVPRHWGVGDRQGFADGRLSSALRKWESRDWANRTGHSMEGSASWVPSGL